MRNLEWFDGAPEKLEPGMVVRVGDPVNRVLLVGHTDAAGESKFSGPDDRLEKLPEAINPYLLAWAWVIKPHELEWAADMACKHAKGRPEQ